MKITVTKADGTQDVFGAALSVRWNGEDCFLTISHAGPDARNRVKEYSSGNYRDVAMDPQAKYDYDIFPADCRVE